MHPYISILSNKVSTKKRVGMHLVCYYPCYSCLYVYFLTLHGDTWGQMACYGTIWLKLVWYGFPSHSWACWVGNQLKITFYSSNCSLTELLGFILCITYIMGMFRPSLLIESTDSMIRLSKNRRGVRIGKEHEMAMQKIKINTFPWYVVTLLSLDIDEQASVCTSLIPTLCSQLFKWLGTAWGWGCRYTDSLQIHQNDKFCDW